MAAGAHGLPGEDAWLSIFRHDARDPFLCHVGHRAHTDSHVHDTWQDHLELAQWPHAVGAHGLLGVNGIACHMFGPANPHVAMHDDHHMTCSFADLRSDRLSS